jgi:spermidine synthase
MSDRKTGVDPPRMIEMPSPFGLEPGTVRLRQTGEPFTSAQLDRLREGTLGRPFIIDHGHTRNLFFTTLAIQSSMRLDDPDALVAPYTRKMMAFLLFRPAPRHVLMIGLGGGSLAKFCYRHLPRTRITVVEISAEIIALRDEFSIPRDDERFEIVHDDGAAVLRDARMQPDVIMIDAFDESGISPALATPGVYVGARRALSPDGMLVMNLSGQKSRYTAHIESLLDVFSGIIRLVPVEGEDNLVLFAFRQQQSPELPESMSQRAACLEHGLGLEFSRYLERLRSGQILRARGDLPAVQGMSS